MRSRSLLSAAAMTLLLAACGGDGGGGVAPSAYASDVCTALSDYLSTVQGRVGDLLSGLGADASPEQGKVALQEYLDNLIDDTEQTIQEIERAGAPDVDDGEALADQLTARFEDARAALQDAREEVDDIPTDDPAAFQQATSDIGNEIGSSVNAVGGEVEEMRSEELEQAFQESAECEDLPAT